jgi:formyltetrahydrofolate deformylase
MNTRSPDEGRYCLTLACRSARGQVASVTALLERHGAYIEEFAVFDDVLSERFYVRTVFRINGATVQDLDALRAGYATVLAGFSDAEGAIHDMRRPARVLIMVSKADH